MLSYEFTELTLTEDEFWKLQFMGAPDCWNKDNPKFIYSLCDQPLKIVADKVIKESSDQKDSSSVFNSITEVAPGDPYPWFRSHALLAKHFNFDLMPHIWIRNLWEDKSSNDYSFYTEDGNHRTLVYAVRLLLKEESYRGVRAIHSTSWDIAAGILGHLPQPASSGGIQNNGKLQQKDKVLYSEVKEWALPYYRDKEDSILINIKRLKRNRF